MLEELMRKYMLDLSVEVSSASKEFIAVLLYKGTVVMGAKDHTIKKALIALRTALELIDYEAHIKSVVGGI